MEQIITKLLSFFTTYNILFLSRQAFSNYNKYKLIKNNKVENCKVIYEAPSIQSIKQRSIKQRKNDTREKEKIEDIIKNFVSVISQHVSQKNMEAINQNLQHLGYHEGILQSLFLSIGGFGGIYKTGSHTISGNIRYRNNDIQNVLYHELLHSVTSAYIPNKNLHASGFSQNNLGRSITEGYTELLNQRYFKSKIESGYKYDIAVAEMVEFIVGREKMTDLYFSIDLKGLISELSCYQSEDKVKQFILDLDTIHELRLHKDKYATILQSNDLTLASLYNRVSIFLYNAFLNKSNEIFNRDDRTYLQESKRFLELFSKIEQTTRPKKGKKDITQPRIDNIPQVNSIYEQVTQVGRPKIRGKTKGEPNNTNIYTNHNKNGFIDIIATLTLLIFIITIAVVTASLLLQTR